MKYNIFQNVKYVYSPSLKRCQKLKYLLFINFLTELLVPFSATIITTIVVYALTNQLPVNQYILIILGLCLLTFVLNSLRNWSYLTYTFENIFTRNSTFMIRLADHQLSTDYMNVEPKSRRDIISKAFEAIGSNLYGVELMMRSAPTALFNLVGMLVYGVMIVFYSPYVVLILVAMTVVNVLLTARANKYLASQRDRIGKLWDERYYLSQDATNHKYGKDIRVYKMRDWFARIFVFLTKERTLIGKRVEKKFLVGELTNTIFLFIRDLIAYTTLTIAVLSQSIDVTTFTFLIGIVTGFTLWLNAFVKHFNDLRSGNIATNEYRECLRTENRFNHGEGENVAALEKPISIEFKDVCFQYPDSSDYVLEDLSFNIKGGEKVAVVGDNGAGKTTIVKLLCGLYQPTKGEILVNGIRLSDINLEEYQKMLSVVFQDSEPLAFTIEQNIACTVSREIDSNKVWKCLENAGLDEKVKSLPLKEKTYLTQEFNKDGIKLSGGENQKLMLARALYKQASMLILDEPTAALDPISEERMYLTYEEFLQGNTSIFISHRLSSTKFCDRILFIRDGRIIEEGKHDDLMKANGEYHSLFQVQAKYYQEEEQHEED